MNTYPTPSRHDSTMKIHKKLSEGKHSVSDTVTKWYQSFFPDQLPQMYHTYYDLKSYTGYSDFYDYLPITYLKSKNVSLTTKIIHPAAFAELCDIVHNNVFLNVPPVLSNSWSKCSNIHYASAAESLKSLR
eukprot:NODE_682_length_5232_cov_0.148646.p4 type:complete len:131 gc:universal NODE_682_length_5232_cov_0.148646:4928-4536(-)